MPLYRLYFARNSMESAHTHDGPPLPWAAIVQTWHMAAASTAGLTRLVYAVRQVER